MVKHINININFEILEHLEERGIVKSKAINNMLKEGLQVNNFDIIFHSLKMKVVRDGANTHSNTVLYKVRIPVEIHEGMETMAKAYNLSVAEVADILTHNMWFKLYVENKTNNEYNWLHQADQATHDGFMQYFNSLSERQNENTRKFYFETPDYKGDEQ